MTYFKDETSEYLYYLLELDGKIKTNKLGITKRLYSNKEAALKWKEKIEDKLTDTTHEKYELGIKELEELYNFMIF